MLARLRQGFRGSWTAMVAGGFYLLPIGRVMEKNPTDPVGRLIFLFLFGAICGLVILGAIRVFKTARWGYLVAGPLAGSLPVVVMAPSKMSSDDFGGLWLLASILGLFIALLEWQRTSALAAKEIDSAV